VKVRPGEFAPAGVTATPLILLGSLKPLHLRVDVDEHEAWRVRPAAKAIATICMNHSQDMARGHLIVKRFEAKHGPKMVKGV